MQQPLLTIAIPTYNRQEELAQTLCYLNEETRGIPGDVVELLISDNNVSEDEPNLIKESFFENVNVRIIFNKINIGSDKNIAQCFNEARGKYVLILGDDDCLINNSLKNLVQYLERDNYGVIYLRAYGYNKNPKTEYPGNFGTVREYRDANQFISRLAHQITFISCCVINKQLIQNLDASQFVGCGLVQVYLVLRAALASDKNLYVSKFSIAARRNNSGGYDFFKVFVKEFSQILNGHKLFGLSERSKKAIDRKMLVGFLPYYCFVLRRDRKNGLDTAYKYTREYYGTFLLFWLFVAPILLLPRWLALIWGSLFTAIGRSLTGDLIRGVYFATHFLLGKFHKTAD